MTQSINLGPQENRLLLTLAEKGISVFSFDEAKDILQTSNPSVRHVLMDLTRKGRLQRIQRGKYLLVPEKAGRELYWAESPWVIVPHLIDVYYVGFWTAMNYWGMTEQIPYTVFVVTTKRKNSLKFGNQKFEFVTLSKKKFFGFVEQNASETETFNISSKEKTIVDGLMHPEYCGGIPEVTKAMWNVRKDVNWKEVLEMAKKIKVDVVLRRLGYLLNILQVEYNISESIIKNLKPYRYHYLDPSAAKTIINHSIAYGLFINRTKEELLGWKDY
jgi:predicted transcriptional regulator of viral defense system